MYIYNELDKQLVRERVAQFRGQTLRFLQGDLSEQAFLPLRLQNGLYIQRHAPMLRVAVPYGMLSSRQLRKLAQISRDYDKGYCHITTRQNIQFNWPQLEDIPALLQELAEVDMHAIQTSGNCIRNVTSDPFAGVAVDEVIDPRPYCEIVRQWSTLHPEFAFLPRKFKIAISGSCADRAAIKFHDIGLQLVRRGEGEHSENGFCVYVGGGLGRTPIAAPVVRDFLPERDLLSYLCAILRVYNQLGRRDNKYKARIKILVRAAGVEDFAKQVEAEWQRSKDHYPTLSSEEISAAKAFFSAPNYSVVSAEATTVAAVERELKIVAEDLLAPSQYSFRQWLERNTGDHKVPGYRTVTLSLKPTGVAAGDITDQQLLAVADLADRYSFGEVRTTQQQNIVLADVRASDLLELWLAAQQHGFSSANIGTLTDITCCPGGDYCSLANAKSIPVADAIQRRFDDMDYNYDLGDLSLKISGCMNACAHHNISHIGILGVDKKGREFYQVMLGGSSGDVAEASVGKVLGPAFSADEIPDVLQKLLDVYVDKRHEGERFIESYNRLGMTPFKSAVYPAKVTAAATVRKAEGVGV